MAFHFFLLDFSLYFLIIFHSRAHLDSFGQSNEYKLYIARGKDISWIKYHLAPDQMYILRGLEHWEKSTVLPQQCPDSLSRSKREDSTLRDCGAVQDLGKQVNRSRGEMEYKFWYIDLTLNHEMSCWYGEWSLGTLMEFTEGTESQKISCKHLV